MDGRIAIISVFSVCLLPFLLAIGQLIGIAILKRRKENNGEKSNRRRNK